MEGTDGMLTVGAIREIRVNGTNCVEEPVLQCLSTKQVGNPPNNRYRAIVSDSQTFIQAMFATQLNPLVESNEVQKNALMKITEYTVNAVKDRTIMIIHNIEIIGQPDNKIGEPASIDQFLEAEAAAAAAGGAASSQPAEDADMQETAAAPPVNPYSAAAANNNNNARGGRGGAAAGGARGGRGGAAASNRGGAAGGGRGGGGGGGNAVPSGSSHPIYPIEGLSPYQNKWTIKARVTNKSDIRHWSNAKGEGKLFSCTLLDDTGEIKATGFNDTVDAFYNVLEEGKVFFISKARVGIAKKQFSNVNNEYEISLENSTEISLCTDTENVPQVKYSFVDLANLEQVEANSTCDVIGIIKEAGEVSQITSKATQKAINKRELVLVDSSNMQVRLTLWGRQAENFSAAGFQEDGSNLSPVIAFKGVKVGDFNGRSLSMVSSSSMMVDPDIPEAHQLRGWYDNGGETSNFTAYQNTGSTGAGAGAQMKPADYLNIGQVKESMLGSGDQPDYFCVRATFVYVKKENLSYPACPTDRCNKKMSMEDQDTWRCEKCERTYPAPNYRYVLSGQVADFTGFLYISGFDEVGNLLLGRTANELEKMKEEDEVAFNSAIDKAMGQTWNLAIRAKNEQYNDQAKIRYQVTKAASVDYAAEGSRLWELIEQYPH